LDSARFIFKTLPSYKDDLTPTQYENALEWLLRTSLVDASGRIVLSPEKPAHQVLQSALVQLEPAWLADADLLIRDEGGLPIDVLELGALLGLDEKETLECVASTWRKYDDQAQRALGLAGELAMLEWLAGHVDADIVHVSEYDDTAGFDIALTRDGVAKARIEVKATRRADSLVFFLSRNEFDTMRRTPSWCLQVVSLDREDRLRSVGWIRADALESWAPADGSLGVWQSMRVSVPTDAITPGAAPPVRDLRRDKGVADRLPLP
jgi:hypothetical protein